MNFKPFLALQASAGSGKTFALSVRFVALILMNAKINEILALTFTKKASNEMKKRIVETFLNLHKDSKKEELRALCNLLEKDKDEILFLRDQKKQEFLQYELRISTFDAFFSKILRAFALNLGLMSDFQISEEKLKIKDIFLQSLDDEKLKDLAFYMVNLDDKEKFLKDLESLYENYFFMPIEEVEFPDRKKINEAYLKFKDYAISLNDKQLLNNFKLDDLYDDNLNAFLKTSFMEEFENVVYLQKLDEDLEFRVKKQEFFDVLDEYAKEIEKFKISKLMNLFKYYKKAKDKLHKEKNILSFTDINIKVYELINDDLKDMIYFRLDGYISHLLIDEFQDTNVLQYQILKPIIAELVSGEGVKKFRTFFYVGDKKQSIYRFRNGKKELFDLLQKDFPQIKKENLNTNYRSKELLVNFVNDAFKDKYKDYIFQNSLDDESKKGGFIRIVSSQEQNINEIKEKTLQTLYEQILFLKNKNATYESICILCWRNNDADIILEYLNDKNIPAYTQSNILLENKASVRLVIEYAKYCIFKDEYYLCVLKSLLGEDKNFIKLNLDLSKNPAQIALYLIKKLKLDLNDIALMQFLEYAKNKENFLELLFEPCPLKIISKESFGISIMSIHKSKGLEFDNVIVLDNLGKDKNNDEKILLEYDVDNGWELRIKSKILKSTKESKYLNFLNKIKQLDYEDDINKLYVAFTRAKNSLFIIKRNEDIKDQRYISYFNGKYLNLNSLEFGEFPIQISKYEKNDLKLKDKLDDFVNIGLQELDQKKEENDFSNFTFGNALHYFMQNIDFKNRNNYEILSLKTKDKFRYFLNDEEFNDLFNRINMLLNDDKFNQLLLNKKLYKEQKISFNKEIKQVDLLAIDENEAFVFDYKTSIFKHEDYINQILFYKNAIKNITNKDTKAFLVYVLKDKIKIENI